MSLSINAGLSVIHKVKRCQQHFVIQQRFMAKTGRPKTPKTKARAPGLSVRLTPEERKAIEAAIQRSGLSQSEWARKGLLYVASNGISLA